ncbi:hypothetical protein [Parabacteroides merdae]|jgi:hypothetical protein|uniref:hypothetical protein n=1 Tax=Parabacteroides merdae TaxID=46503 RepID=UPI0034A3CAB7
MRAEKIRYIIGDYLYDFWVNGLNNGLFGREKILSAKNILKQTLEYVDMPADMQYRKIAEYELLCRLSHTEMDLNYEE